MTALTGPLRALAEQPAVRRSLPAIGTAGALGLAALAWWSFQTPPQRSLFEGLSDADKSAVVTALQASGISYTLNPDSGAVQVGDGDLQRARILLAGQGLPKAAPAGDALIANLPLGSSRAVEGETLRSAHETDLARTIEAIDSVKTAKVHLAMPDPSPFVRDQRPPAASVMLTIQSGRALSEAQVRAIQQLVASSVSGLAADQVSVVDQSGALLSGQGASADDKNFQLQLQAENRFRQALTTLLTPMLGDGNFTAEVHADIDPSESQSTRESYPQNDRALRSEEGNKTTSATTNAPAVGIPGALSNQPPPPTQLASQAPAQTPAAPAAKADGDSTETYSRSFDVGREISVTHNPEGRLHRISVAVAINETGKKRSPADVAAIEGLVKGAVGFDQGRGDIVVVTSRPFAPVEVTATSFWDKPWFMPLARQLGALLAALLAFLFVGRPLMKALKGDKKAAAGDAAETAALTGAAGATLPPPPVTLDMIETAPSYEARADLVRNFVRQDREKASLVVKQMVETR
ncbi:flagellar M-ring protein FliF [Sphingomonas ginkgonis]|uniref:Flagellar M-ring protein n=2 Tax=Sphingomonas ginkgonis TaxID=2315330 RepID=A0A3R9WSJ6_9SPHN|nr:flagellar M-ring protein FliF [Sphingomonas ginkgonis]